MRIQPRYDGLPVIQVDGLVGDVATPLIRQRRRLASTVAELSADQWSMQSRCDAWSVRDVIAHLVGVDAFWLASIQGALAGTPTRYLADFDPVATPNLGVEMMRSVSTDEVLSRFQAGVEDLASVIGGLDDAQWALPAETPPGHVALHVLARHALWDAWIHERDIGVPLGIDTPQERDEVLASLEYVAAIGPAILVAGGSTREGALVIDSLDPVAHIVIEVGDCVLARGGEAPGGALALTGQSVDLLEALSCRAPLPADIAAEDPWLLSGLREVFEVR